MNETIHLTTASLATFASKTRRLAVVLCVLALLVSAQGKTTSKISNQTASSGQLNPNNGKNFPLQATAASASVRQNVSVEAVLLPFDVCKRVFGTEIAKNYAAVELTVSNRSHDSALIVQSVFIDYRDWALSGIDQLDTTRTGGKKSDGPGDWPDYQAPNTPGQISSVEYRVARGELLDRQPWTLRNLSLRALQTAGSIATAYTFSISEKGIITGIGAFNGEVVPALNALFPDGTVGQMNRISDVGFQVNKVIPKDASDIIVAFFPLDRFLTPGLKKLFLKSPALFFAPYALMFDKEARQLLAPQMAGILGPCGNADLFMRQLSVSFINSYDSKLDETPPGQLSYPNQAGAGTNSLCSSALTAAAGFPAGADSAPIGSSCALYAAGLVCGCAAGLTTGANPTICDETGCGKSNIARTCGSTARAAVSPAAINSCTLSKQS